MPTSNVFAVRLYQDLCCISCDIDVVAMFDRLCYMRVVQDSAMLDQYFPEDEKWGLYPELPEGIEST